MQTRSEQMTSGGIDGYTNFIGDDSDYRDWYGVIGQSRDADALERANFATALKQLGGEGADVRVESFGHWAVGWVEEIYVRPGSAAENVARAIHQQLENYPALDDDDYSREEAEEALEYWQSLRPADRVEFMRHHDYYARSVADVLRQARGNEFTGNASELLGN